MTTPWSNQAISLIVLIEETTGFSGLFGYSPTPANGDLVFSIAAAGGTDPYGNTYLAGISTYPSGVHGISAYAGQQLAVELSQVNMNGLAAVGLSVVNLTLPGTISPGFYGGVTSNGSHGIGKVAVALMTSGTSGVSDTAAQIFMSSKLTEGASTSNIALEGDEIEVGTLSTLLVFDQQGYVSFNNNVATVPPAATIAFPNVYSLTTPRALGIQTAATGVATTGLQGFVPVTQGQQSTITVTAAAMTALSPAYAVPASDGVPGTIYRLCAWGDGTTGSTAQTLGFRISAFGGVTTNVTAGALWASISEPFVWRMCCDILITVVGAAGAGRCVISSYGGLSLSGVTLLPNSNTANATLFMNGSTTGLAITTTTAGTVTLQASWGSTTGASTLTCRASTFERLGQ